MGTDVVVDFFRRDGISILFTANSSAGGGSVAEGFPYRLTPIGSYATYYVRVRGAAPNVTGSYRIMVAACPGQPELPLAAASLRANGLRLSWPAAVEPSVVRFSRDLRTWSRLNLSPVLEGDQLRVELPSDAPHQFFQLVPAGGWSNDTLSCCNANGCVPYPPGGCPNDTIIWCRDEGEGTTCTALPPITEPEPD